MALATMRDQRRVALATQPRVKKVARTSAGRRGRARDGCSPPRGARAPPSSRAGDAAKAWTEPVLDIDGHGVAAAGSCAAPGGRPSPPAPAAAQHAFAALPARFQPVHPLGEGVHAARSSSPGARGVAQISPDPASAPRGQGASSRDHRGMLQRAAAAPAAEPVDAARDAAECRAPGRAPSLPGGVAGPPTEVMRWRNRDGSPPAQRAR